MKIKKVDGIIIKWHFSKAYDFIDWNCLFHVMECVNLSKTWINWIRAILNTTKMSILVNGSPTEEFSPVRGIKQGDLLAPFLCLLIGEILRKLISKATDRGIFEGINFDFHEDPISHFPYTDNTIQFIKNNSHSIRGLKKVLVLFQVITGLAKIFDQRMIYHVSNDRVNSTAGGGGIS